MALQAKPVPIPFAQGVSTKVDAKQVPLGKLLTLENGFFQTPMEIRKRYGFNALSQSIIGGGTLDAANGQYTFNDELLLSSPSNATSSLGGRFYGYDQANTAWSSVGPYYGCRLTTTPVSGGDVNQLHSDGTYDPISGLKCFIWVNDGATVDIYASISDAVTGKVVFSGSVVSSIGATSRAIRVVYFNNNFFIIYLDTDLKYSRIATSAPTTIAGTGTIAVAPGGAYFDAIASSTRLYVAYGNIKIVYLNTSFALSAVTTTVTAGAGTPQSMALSLDASNNVGAVLGTSTKGYAAAFDANLVVLLDTTSMTASTINIDQTGVCFMNGVFHAYLSRLSTGLMYYARFTTSAVTTVMTLFIREVTLASRPFVYNNNIFLFGYPLANYQPTICMYMHYADSDDTLPACVIGKVAYSNAGSSVFRIAPGVIQVSSGVYQLAYGQLNGVARTDLSGLVSTAPAATWSLTIDFNKIQMGLQIANGLHITGGQLWLYDGLNITEHGFYFYPLIRTIAAGTTGSIANGTYQYVATFEWTDGAGQVHRSAPSSVIQSITLTGSDDSVDLTVDTLTTTNKRGITTTGTIRPTSKVKVCIYRTAASGTIFYFVGSVDNDITASTVAFTDTSADSTILNNIQLYTSGGTVENIGAPACQAITTYKSRLILVPSDNPYSWWFSQEVIPDSEASSSTPVEMSDLFIQNIDQKGGPILGLGTMDDKLILLKKNLPYYIVGSGPSPNGSNNDYSPPQSVTSPVGSVNADSIAETPLGLMFQAANGAGIWLLDRSLSASYIGSDVEAYNSQTVTSSIVYPQYNQIRFTTSGGVCLAYDYYVKQWTVLTNVSTVQAVVFQGQYTYIRSTALVLQESTSTFTDNGTFVQLKVGTSWIKFAGLQGFQRIYEAQILGDYETAHSLVAKVYYDFDPAVAQTTTIAPTSVAPYQWRLLFNRQKCEAMKIELYDTQVSPAEGMRLSAITLLAGIKKGTNKMAAARTFE